MDVVTIGTIQLSWEADKRLAVIAFSAPTQARGADARELVEAMKRWLGDDRKPFALLGDGGKLTNVDAEYRAAWAEFFRAHRDDAFIAFFNMGLFVRVAADMFRVGTGIRLRAFTNEADARAWLRDMGIDA